MKLTCARCLLEAEVAKLHGEKVYIVADAVTIYAGTATCQAHLARTAHTAFERAGWVDVTPIEKDPATEREWIRAVEE